MVDLMERSGLGGVRDDSEGGLFVAVRIEGKRESKSPVGMAIFRPT